MDISCQQPEPLQLRCSFRLLDDDILKSVVAEFDGIVVEGELEHAYPQPGDATTILLLVDTSDPARQRTIDQIARHIGELLEAGRQHQRFGLATFDTDLALLEPPGSTAGAIRAAAARLVADGRTTELYRNVREAVRLLGQDAGARKVLILMSDGLAEDFAYHHEDVVAEARKEQVIIHSLGYPRSIAQSVALQSMRRLADETGGLYAQANVIDYGLPQGVFKRMLAAVETGGQIAFDLGPLLAAGARGPIDLALAFQTTDRSFLALVPIVLPDPPAETAAVEIEAQIARGHPAQPSRPQLAPPTPLPPRPAGTMPPAAQSWLLPLTAVLTLLTAAVVIIIALRWRRSISAATGRSAATPLAYIVLADLQRTRHPIDKTPWRIGRGRNNDLVLTDHSVSRLHAEIRNNDEGLLLLNDLESLNGVFVNDTRVSSIQLRDGDKIDVGDVRMHFTLHDEDYAAQEATVIVRTRAPE
ncbi:MAG: FHA domain-containing protein [Gammaproteobacteria bacterium]